MANLNEKILLAHQVNGRWVIDEDTYKGNLPAPDYQIVTPQQAQQRLQENVGNLQSEINFYTAQHGAGAGTVTRRQAELAGLQQQINKFANYTPPASTGQQYTRDASGNLITKENLANFVAPGARAVPLTQAQLTAQNARLGRTQTNPAPAPTGTLLGAPITSASIQQGIANLKPPPNMTPAQQAAWNNAVALIPKTGGSITTGSLQSGSTPPDISSVGKNSLDEAGAVVAGMGNMDKFINDYIKAREVPTDPKITSLESSLASLMGESANRGADQAQAELAQGVQAKKEALTAINGKISQLQAEFQAYSLDQEGKPITLASIQGSVAAKRNAIAGEMLMLQSQALLLTGQYNDAVSAANRSVDLKYLDVEQKIKNQTALLELYKDDFDDKEKLKADAVNEYLRQQSVLVTAQKASEKELNSTKLSAMRTAQENGAPVSVINAISAAQSPEEAMIAMGTYGANVQDRQLKQLQIQKAQQDLAGGGTGGAGAVAGEVSPYQQERAFRTTQSVNELRRTAVANPGIFGRTAALPVPGFLRSDAFRNFSSELNTLKSSIAFGELTAMREASKTGGALGQVSDREGKLLESALGALEMNQSPENFVKQLDKINASITRWQNAMASAQTSGTLITAPNGDIIEITD